MVLTRPLHILAVLFVLAAPALAPDVVSAGAPEIYTGSLAEVGAGGYDVVAYALENRPVQGRASLTATHRGVAWRFATEDHRARFLADPDRYVPSFGGHCAWAASQGYAAPGDPKAWAIIDGRLFFNYDQAVHRRWLANVPENISRADQNWPAIRAGR